MEKIYLQITAGRGPRECAYVVARLLATLEKEARGAGVTTSLVGSEVSDGPLPEALLSATVLIQGPAAQSFADGWLGTIQWIGVSPYRPKHKRKNWFVGITRVAGPMSVGQLAGKIVVETMRASGPGGQNVNKTNSAVRVTHVETGISVTARESRSQVQNQRMAREKVQEKFDQHQKDLVMARHAEKWADHQLVERGNSVRVFHRSEFIER